MLSRFASVWLLSFTTGIHSGIIRITIGLWLCDCGTHIVYLCLMNLITLPYCVKFFWMPFLETHFRPIRRFGHRKSWLIFVEILVILGLVPLIFINPKTVSFLLLVLYATFLCVLVTTKESIAIAYQMETIKAEKWGASEGKIASGYNLGIWFSGTLLYLWTDFVRWNTVFSVVILILFSLWFLNFLIPDSNFHSKELGTFKERFLDQYKELIVRNRTIIFSLIAFIALYRLQDRILTATGTYFFIDLQFSKLQIFFGKTLDIFVTILGGFAGSLFVKKFGYKKTLVFGLIIHTFSACLFLVQSMVPKSYALFYSIMSIEKMVRGFESTVFFTYQMIFCSKYFITTQLALLLGLDKLTSSIVGSLSGFIIDSVGWTSFFGLSFIGTIPAILLLKKLPNSIAQEEKIAEKNLQN